MSEFANKVAEQMGLAIRDLILINRVSPESLRTATEIVIETTALIKAIKEYESL